MKTEKVEGALVKVNILRLAMTALAEQNADVANDLYHLLGLVHEIREEIEEAVKEGSHEPIPESHCL